MTRKHNAKRNISRGIGRQVKAAASKFNKAAKRAHLGRFMMETAMNNLAAAVPNPSQPIAYGRGAYGRGAYGRGSYNTTKPSVNSLFNEYPHRRHKTREVGDETGRVKVSRREYVMRVTAPATSVEFQNTSFSINPGLEGVFAWLSQNASNYDEYTLKHLTFHYKPVISQASTSGAMGSILFSANYNAGSEKFESFREMAEYMGTVETRICDPCIFGIECDPTKHGSNATQFIRTGTVPVGEDIKSYDLALFQVATSDVGTFAEGTLLGHLYVEYEVVLGKPKLYTALGKGIKCDMFRCPTQSPVVTGAHIFYQSVPNPSNNLGVHLTDGSSGGNGVITFPDNFYGRVCITFYIGCTGIVWGTPILTGNVTNPSICGPLGNSATETINYDSDTGKAMIQMYADISASSGGIPNSVTLVTTIGSFSYSNLDVTQVNPDFDQW